MIIDFKERGKEIFNFWDEYAKTGNISGLLSLYTEDTCFESPLVPVLLEREEGTLKNKKGLEQNSLKKERKGDPTSL